MFVMCFDLNQSNQFTFIMEFVKTLKREIERNPTGILEIKVKSYNEEEKKENVWPLIAFDEANGEY